MSDGAAARLGMIICLGFLSLVMALSGISCTLGKIVDRLPSGDGSVRK